MEADEEGRTVEVEPDGTEAKRFTFAKPRKAQAHGGYSSSLRPSSPRFVIISQSARVRTTRIAGRVAMSTRRVLATLPQQTCRACAARVTPVCQFGSRKHGESHGAWPHEEPTLTVMSKPSSALRFG